MRQKFHTLRPSEPQITPPGGPREQIVPQRQRPQHPALHPVQNSGEIAGPENRRGGSEFRDGSADGGGRREVPGVGDEDREHMKNGPDTPRDRARFRGGRTGRSCSVHWDAGSRVERTKQELNDRMPNMTDGSRTGAWARRPDKIALDRPAGQSHMAGNCLFLVILGLDPRIANGTIPRFPAAPDGPRIRSEDVKPNHDGYAEQNGKMRTAVAPWRCSTASSPKL